MEGPISFWGYKEQESNLILPEHDDDDEDYWWKETEICEGVLRSNCMPFIQIEWKQTTSSEVIREEEHAGTTIQA